MKNIQVLAHIEERVILRYWDEEVRKYLANGNENQALDDLYELVKFFGMDKQVNEYLCLPCPPEAPEPEHGYPHLRDLMRDK